MQDTGSQFAKQDALPEAAAPAAPSRFMAPPADAPIGNMTFQQFLEREMMDPTNSAEMVRGYMEMHAALMEGKLNQSDIDAIQFGRNEGMGGNSMRQKFDAMATAIETIMREHGEAGFKITRPTEPVAEAPVLLSKVEGPTAVRKPPTMGM